MGGELRQSEQRERAPLADRDVRAVAEAAADQEALGKAEAATTAPLLLGWAGAV